MKKQRILVNEFKKLLARNGYLQTEISQKLGYNKHYVTTMLYNKGGDAFLPNKITDGLVNLIGQGRFDSDLTDIREENIKHQTHHLGDDIKDFIIFKNDLLENLKFCTSIKEIEDCVKRITNKNSNIYQNSESVG